MNTRTPLFESAPTAAAAPPVRLQRKCACGGLDRNCKECRKKGMLQRKSAGRDEPELAPSIVHEVLRSPGRPLDPASRAFMEPRFGHDFARLEVDRPGELEDEANRVAAGVVANAGEPLSVPVRSVAPLALQKQERPETPPSITTLPGEVPADPEAEEEKKTAAMWEKLGTELAKEALKRFGKIPGVAEVYKAIEDFFDLPAVQIVGGIGYTATAATAIVVNAMDMQSRTEPGTVPPEETMFGVKGTWDFTSPPKDIKVTTPIGDLPPSLSEEQASSGGSTTLAGKPPSAPEDPIGKRLREAQEEQFVMNWVLSRQDQILNPVKESRQKPAGRKKRKKKRKAPRKPAAASERRRREDEWPSFKRRSESAALAHDEPEVADAGRRTPGRPLDPEIRDRLERSLGCDFGRVRVHADAASAAAAEALNARAYTVGLDVVFGVGEYRPATAEGLGLLAHELTHVVQQGGAQPVRGSSDEALRRDLPSSRTGPSQAAPRTGPSAIVGVHWSETPPPAPLLQRKCACAGSGTECDECGAKARLHRKAMSGEDHARVPAIVDEVLRSPGRPLDEGTRAFMELHFGHDFGQVRVHADTRAAASAQDVNALAYTVGRDVVFGHGRYAPETGEGRHLLAHELAHTVQQRSPSTPLGQLHPTQPGDALETEADRAAEALLADNPISITSNEGIALARQYPEGPTRETPEELEEKERLEKEFRRARSISWGREPGLQTWGWGGPEAENLYHECTVAPMDRQTFRSFLKTLPSKPRRNKPKDADDVMGVTHFDPNDAVPPEIAASPVQDDGRTLYKVKPAHAEMPPIQSAYTKIEKEPKEFVEGSLPYAKQECNDFWRSLQKRPKGRYDIIWLLPDDGAEKFREAEQEHCDDIRLAFDLTLGLFASAINNLAARERTYSTEKRAVDEAIRWVGVKPDQMLLEFYNMALKTEVRDNKGWHTATCVTKNHCQEPDPEKNQCRGYVNTLDAASLPDVGNHSSHDVVTFEPPKAGGKK